MPARILITGANGFVGSHLARRIASAGDVALGVGIEPPGAETAAALTQWWPADVLDGPALRAAFGEGRPDGVIHLAAQSSGAASFERPVETYRVNALGTLTLLDAVHHAAPRARVLVIGTGEVYGSLPEGSRVSESAPFSVVSPYALSKAAADTLAESCGRLWSLDVLRVRAFGHIGPGQTDRFLVPSMARQIAEIEAGRQEPTLKVGNLDVVRDFTDVRDVVEAYLALLARGRSGAAYNVCRGEGTRLDDLTRSLCARSRVEVRIEVDPARVRSAEVRYLVGDPSAITRDTGWSARLALDRTLDDVLEEWRGKVRAAPSQPAPGTA